MNSGNIGDAMNTCPLCDHEGMIPFIKEGQKTFCKCPACSCEWEEDRDTKTRVDHERDLVRWAEGVAGWVKE